jgi:hypothetical protein
MSPEEPAGPYWGVMRFAEIYHRSKYCRCLVGTLKNDNYKVCRYDSDREAFVAGHLRPCRACSGGVYSKDGDDPIRLTEKQMNSLVDIYDLYVQNKVPMKFRDMAKACNKSLKTTHGLVQILIRKKFLSKIMKKRGGGTGCIVFTPFGAKMAEFHRKQRTEDGARKFAPQGPDNGSYII